MALTKANGLKVIAVYILYHDLCRWIIVIGILENTFSAIKQNVLIFGILRIKYTVFAVV